MPVGDYYDRLALDRALATIEAAHRALTAKSRRAARPRARRPSPAGPRSRGPAMARIVASVEADRGSGLTLSKLTVAASLLATSRAARPRDEADEASQAG